MARTEYKVYQAYGGYTIFRRIQPTRGFSSWMGVFPTSEQAHEVVDEIRKAYDEGFQLARACFESGYQGGKPGLARAALECADDERDENQRTQSEGE